MKTARKFYVTGPGAVGGKACPSERAALSYAFTLGSAGHRDGAEVGTAWYIRNEDGDIEGRVEVTPAGLESTPM